MPLRAPLDGDTARVTGPLHNPLFHSCMTAYCEPDDVRRALQERSLDGAVSPANVEPSIRSVSDWLRRRSHTHWYDSRGGVTFVDSAPATATDVRRDVPSSPHATDRQITLPDADVRYPVTRAGPYAKIPLPHRYVETIDTLLVRDVDGDTTDWTASPDFQAGRGEAYYVATDGASEYGRSYLFINARDLGARTDYGDLLTLDYQYGLDADSQTWQNVRRGVALLAAAQLVVDDNVLTAIPDNGQLVGVDTQRQQLVDDGTDLLDPYLGSGVA
jgi:hypothetical protein